jgi:YfiH family protein
VKDTFPFLLHPFPEWAGRVSAAFTTRYLRGRSHASDAEAAHESNRRLAVPAAYADMNLGFRGGDDPDRVARNWLSVLEAEGLAGKTLVLPRMVHGTTMFDADGLPPVASGQSGSGAPMPESGLRKREPENADALCARSDSLVLAVTMADCLTALIFDPGTGTMAAVHAGWRGTRAGILGNSLRSLLDSGGIRAESVLVAFGPCLRRDSLEVGPEVAEQLDPAFLIRRDGKCYFDMPADNRAQALACGISSDRIRDMGGCTLTEPERYFSYRRDGQASGRMAAFISLRQG